MITQFEAANYILTIALERDPDSATLTNLKLQKILYYTQCANLSRTGERLFDNTFEAWQHGPVLPKIYKLYSKYKAQPIDKPAEFDKHLIPGETKTLFNAIYSYFGQFDAWKLRDMTH